MHKHSIAIVHVYTNTLERTHTHIPGPSLALLHSAGMSVWRQAVVCAPGMRNLTSGLEFEPPHSSSLFQRYALRAGPGFAQQSTPETERLI